MLATLWLACTGSEDGDKEREPYLLDGVLRLNELQAKGTHNSYHVQSTSVLAWSYTHAPLDVQLQDQGVRQFELDVYWDAARGEHLVLHVPLLDAATTCETFVACLDVMQRWSRDHAGHHPLLVLVETKDLFDAEEGPALLDALDQELLQGWPREHLLTPSDVMGDHPDLSTAIAEDGWPVLGELRGHAMFVLHDDSSRRDAYVADLAERPMFPDAMGDLDPPWSGVHSLNDPENDPISEVVSLGHLVRTRADDDPGAIESSMDRRDLALASGAQFVSTDFPAPVEGTSYRVEIPEGTPSRCNPVTAAAAIASGDCTSLDIEDPDKL